MIDIDIKIDTKVIERQLAGFAKQIPYATAVALNETAKDAQKDLRNHLKDDFTIRNKFVSMGILFYPKYPDKKRLRVEIGSRDEFMVDQALGGEKKRKEKALSIPVGTEKGEYHGVGRPRPKLKSMTKPSKWPGELMEKHNVFIGRVKFKTGKTISGVWQRMAKPTKWKTAKTGLRLLYQFKKKVKIPERWPLEERVNKTVDRKWYNNALRAVEYALRTAK